MLCQEIFLLLKHTNEKYNDHYNAYAAMRIRL